MPTNISKYQLQGIKRALPHFKRIIEFDEKFLANRFYKHTSISVFDHWLNDEESERLLNIDSNLQELELRRKKFCDSALNLLEHGPIYTWRYKRHYRLHVRQINSHEDLLRICDFENLNSLTGNRYGLLLPKLRMMYFEGFDWTNQIYYHEPEHLNTVLAIFNSHGLYQLNNN